MNRKTTRKQWQSLEHDYRIMRRAGCTDSRAFDVLWSRAPPGVVLCVMGTHQSGSWCEWADSADCAFDLHRSINVRCGNRWIEPYEAQLDYRKLIASRLTHYRSTNNYSAHFASRLP